MELNLRSGQSDNSDWEIPDLAEEAALIGFSQPSYFSYVFTAAQSKNKYDQVIEQAAKPTVEELKERVKTALDEEGQVPEGLECIVCT